MQVKDYIRRDLRGWQNYQVQPVSGRKMDANESPFPLPDAVKRELSRWLLEEENFRLYPETDNTELRETIAAGCGIRPDQITCTVGSDQMIDYLTKVFLEPGESILVPEPTFSMYETAAVINHGRAFSFPLDEAHDYRYDAEVLLESVRKVEPKLLFLCTPNNPTGAAMPLSSLQEIAEQTTCLIVLDEAYGEFSDVDTLPLILEYPRIISLRTFSKAYGLAGLRVGYAIADPDLIRAIDLVRAPYNLNTFSQKAAALVFGRAEYREHVGWIRAERDRMYQALKEMEGVRGFHCYPSDANYLFMKSDVKNPGAYMLRQGLLPRSYGESMAGCLRVTVSDRDSNDLFLAQMRRMLLVEENE